MPKPAPTVIALWLAVALSAPGRADEPRLDISISPQGQVGLQELLQVKLTVESNGRVDVSRPTFRPDKLQVVSGPNQSTSVRFINGVSSQTLGYSWIVQPTALGTAGIRDVSVTLDGNTVSLPDRQIEVVEKPPQRARSRGRDPLDIFSRDPFFNDSDRAYGSRHRRRQEQRPPRLFLEAQAVPENPTLGQQVIYTLYLYFDVNVRNASPAKLPDFKGFWTQVLPQPEQTPQERLVRDGREIYRAVLLERALFPHRAGRLTIEPIQATMTALVPDSGVFGSLMPRMTELESTSNPVTVDVRPLPEPKPAGFQGLVGRLRLALQVDRQQLEVGQAATLTLRLEGEGHLQGVPAPTLGEIPGIQIMPPQQQSEEFLDGDRVKGRRIWSFVLVPKRPGNHEIPAVEMPFFDPGKGEYRIAATEAVKLEVKASSRLVASGSQEVSLHPVRTATLPAVGGGRVLSGAWQHLLVLSPMLAGGLLLLFSRRKGGGTRREGRRRMRAALDQAAQAERPREAAALLEEAWRAYLEEKHHIPRGAPSPSWGQLLEDKGAPPAAAAELVQLGDDLHYLRYAPKLSSTSEMRDELIERSRRLIRSI